MGSVMFGEIIFIDESLKGKKFANTDDSVIINTNYEFTNSPIIMNGILYPTGEGGNKIFSGNFTSAEKAHLFCLGILEIIDSINSEASSNHDDIVWYR